MPVGYVTDGEDGSADVLNRPIRDLIKALGINPDAVPNNIDTGGLKSFASDASRDAAIATPVEGQVIYRTDLRTTQLYTAGAWQTDTKIGTKVYADEAARDADPVAPTIDEVAFITNKNEYQRFSTSWKPQVGGYVKYVKRLIDVDNSTLPDAAFIFDKETGEGKVWDAVNSKFITIANRPAQVINAKTYGALGDNTGMTIGNYNTLNGSLASFRRSNWVGVYGDNDTMDYAGLCEGYYAAFGAPGTEHGSAAPDKNFAYYIPSGRYRLSKTPYFNRTLGGSIYGDGKFATQLWIESPNKAAIRTNGFSSSKIAEIGVFASVDNPLDPNSANPARRRRGVLFEIDWDTKGASTGGLEDRSVTSATNPSLGASVATNWVVNQFAGKYLWLVAGSGMNANAINNTGTYWKILSNTANRIFIDNKWTVAIPDGTTKFVITDKPQNRIDGLPFARGTVGDLAGGGAAVTATTLPKMANNTSYWSTVGPWMIDGYDSRLWSVDQFKDQWVLLTSGVGAGQYRRITSNTDRVLTVTPAWNVNPVAGDGYVIIPAPVQVNSTDVASATANTLNGVGVGWGVNSFVDRYVRILSGTGVGQWRRIISNTAIQVTVNVAWTINPDATSKFDIVTGPIGSDNNTPYTVDAATVTDATLKATDPTVNGVISAVTNGSLSVAGTPWTGLDFQSRTVTITSGAAAGTTRVITGTTANSISIPVDGNGIGWVPNPAPGDTFTITLTANQFVDQEVWIVSGTGKGERNFVASNLVDGTIILAEPFDVLPDATSTVRIIKRIAWAGSLQADEFVNLEFSAEGHDVGAGTRTVLHGDSGQGSEMHFRNCFYNWFRRANHINLGFNALQNTWLSGDFQSYRGHGWWVESGAIQAFDVGLQTDRIGALFNLGYDFFSVNSAGDHSVLEGCRSEGYRSIFSGNYHSVTAIGFSSNSFSPNVWSATTQYKVGDIVYPPDAAVLAKRAVPFVVIATIGDRKSGAVMPDFDHYGYGEELVDNNVRWSAYRVTICQGENVHAENCMFNLGVINLPIGTNTGSYYDNIAVSRQDWWEIVGNTQSPHGILGINGVHVHLRGGFNDSIAALPWSVPGSPRLFRSVKMIGGSEGYLIAGGNYGGTPAFPVGFRNGKWTGTSADEAIFAVIGILGKESPVDHYSAGESSPPNYLANTKGENQIIAAGESTGDASVANANDLNARGSIIFRTASPGVAGATPNALVDRGEIDKYGVFTTKFGKVIKSIIANIAAATAYTPDASAAEEHMIIFSGGALTVNSPVWAAGGVPPHGAKLYLIIENDSGGAAVTPVFDAAYKTGAVPALATSKITTAEFHFNSTFNKWYIIGSFSAAM